LFRANGDRSMLKIRMLRGKPLEDQCHGLDRSCNPRTIHLSLKHFFGIVVRVHREVESGNESMLLKGFPCTDEVSDNEY
jgi:hypothetical protein